MSLRFPDTMLTVLSLAVHERNPETTGRRRAVPCTVTYAKDGADSTTYKYTKERKGGDKSMGSLILLLRKNIPWRTRTRTSCARLGPSKLGPFLPGSRTSRHEEELLCRTCTRQTSAWHTIADKWSS
jgi:hypothetical protein